MMPLVLYCKSYRTDVKRVVRLAQSIARFNQDQIPFYVSAPQSDLELFAQYLQGHAVTLISDESIIAENPALDPVRLAQLPGSLSQQIVKSEFWRTQVARTYLCLDSDCIFIRPFRQSEFIDSQGTPYTVIDEGRDLFYPAMAKGKHKVIDNMRRESAQVQQALGREGKHYNFGPNCPVWDRRVWESLDQQYCQPRQLSFMDLIAISPNEQRWYGEALLKYRAIDLLPSQPFFKMYHYAWQLRFDQKAGIQESQLTQLYCGVVYQSAWEREMDWPSEGGSWGSRLGRRLRRLLGRI
jgi:hypothetical protein